MKGLSDFTIVIQGIVSSVLDYENIICFSKFTDDVIFVTWENSLDSQIKDRLIINGIRVIECEDPGSSCAYSTGSIQKYLNINRRLRGFNCGCKIAKYEYVFLTRVDLKFDANRAFEIYEISGKNYGLTNVNTVCPSRFLSPGYYASFCDWLFVGRTSFFVNSTLLEIDESQLQLETVLKIKSQLWNSVLGSEQVFSIIFSGEYRNLKNFSNFSTEGLQELKRVHKKLQSSIVLINWREINLRSTKYRYFTQNWISYQRSDFTDDHFITTNILDLMVYLLASIKDVRR